MINTISMANARTQNQRIPAAGKNQVGFAGLWGKRKKSESCCGEGPNYGKIIRHYDVYRYYPFADEKQEEIDRLKSIYRSHNYDEWNDYVQFCVADTKLPFTEKEYDAFAKNPKSLDETKHKLIHETTKDLYVDANNTMSVHDKIKSLNIAAKPAAVKTATETKVVKPLTIEERLGNLEESMKGIKEGLAKFMDDIAPVIKKLGKDSKK